MSTQNQLYDALSMAVSLLMAHEPPDSRCVSDDVVTLAAIAGRCDNEACHEIVQRFLAKMEAGEGPKPHAPGPDIVVVHVSDDFKREYGIPIWDSHETMMEQLIKGVVEEDKTDILYALGIDYGTDMCPEKPLAPGARTGRISGGKPWPYETISRSTLVPGLRDLKG